MPFETEKRWQKSFHGRAICVWIMGGLVAILVFGRLVRLHDNNQQRSRPAVVVSVQGAVKKPGIYLLTVNDADVGAAMAAAGGVVCQGITSIDQKEIQRRVVNGDALIVRCGSVSSNITIDWEKMPAVARLTLGDHLDINKISEEELLLIPGMTRESASAIVRRRLRSPWKRMDELAELPGIGAKTVKKWSRYLKVAQQAPPAS